MEPINPQPTQRPEQPSVAAPQLVTPTMPSMAPQGSVGVQPMQTQQYAAPAQPQPQQYQQTPMPAANGMSPLPQMPTTPAGQVMPPVIGGPATAKKPNFLVIIVIAVVVLGALTAGAVLMAKPKKKVVKTNTQQTQTTESTGPQPAKALDVEQSNNSINQDISGLNDDDDFPATQIDDKALGL